MRKVLTVLGTLISVCLLALGLSACGGEEVTEVEKYTVTFYDGITEDTILKTEEVEKGGVPTDWIPEDKADGSTFEGWYATPTLQIPYDFTKAITKDTSIFSKWSSVAEDNRVWEIVGNFNGSELKSSNWGKGNNGVDVFKLTKVDGKPNVFEGTFELTKEDQFQFAVLEFSEGSSEPLWVCQAGGGLLEQGDNEWFDTTDNYLDPAAYKSNIDVLVSGEYKFTLTTDVEIPASSSIVVERIGDIEEEIVPFAPVIGGTPLGGSLGSDANADLFFPVGQLEGENIVWTGEFSFNAGELLNILMLNNWDVQLKNTNIDKENCEATNVNLNSTNEIEILTSGKYEVKIVASKNVASVINSDQIGANLETYKDTTQYKVQIKRIGDYELSQGVTYDTFNIKYNGKGTDYTVYVRNNAQFPNVKNPTLAEGEALSGWKYVKGEDTIGVGYKAPLATTGVTYDVEAEIVSSAIEDNRVYWITGQGGTVNGVEAAWSGVKAELTQTGNTTYEATIVVEENEEGVAKFDFQIVSDFYGVHQGIYLRTHNVVNPGDFINSNNVANISIIAAGTYKLVLDSVSGDVTITIVE